MTNCDDIIIQVLSVLWQDITNRQGVLAEVDIGFGVWHEFQAQNQIVIWQTDKPAPESTKANVCELLSYKWM